MEGLNVQIDLGSLSVYDSEPILSKEESTLRTIKSINSLVSRLNQLKVQRFEKT
jgi:hypothetical protein